MKRLKAIVITATIVLGVGAILWHNKAQMQARSKTNAITSYPVSVASVERSTLAETLSLVGTIVANSDVPVVAETQGRVVAVLASVGDYKPAGSVLVQIDDELKKAEFIKAEVLYERAKKDAERFKSLGKNTPLPSGKKKTRGKPSRLPKPSTFAPGKPIATHASVPLLQASLPPGL
mgnify:CR=1 FL=1